MERNIWSTMDRLSDGALEKAIKIVAVLLAVSLLSFGVYYYLDRYGRHDRASVTEKALQSLEEEVRADPSNPGLRVAVAGAYLASNRYKEAIAQYQEALSVQPDNQQALIGVGHALYIAGRQDEAVEPYEQVVELNRDNPGRYDAKPLALVYYNLGSIYLASGRFDEAVESFQETIAVDNADAEARYWLGEAHRKKGQWEKAAAAYRDAIRFVPNYLEAYQGLMTAYTNLGDNVMAGYARGMASYAAKDFKAAIRQLEAVVKERPTLAEAHFGLGLAYEESGKSDSAAVAFRQVLDLEPQNLWAKGSLQRIGAWDGPR